MASKRAIHALRLPSSRLCVSSAGLRRVLVPLSGTHAFTTFTTPVGRYRQLTPALTSQVRFASSTTAEEQLGRTGLYELHAKHGARFVPFGGYEMPLQYSDLTIVDSHNWTREKASLFDVGHM